jgi:DNA-binding beta-propeller fold protein YncE
MLIGPITVIRREITPHMSYISQSNSNKPLKAVLLTITAAFGAMSIAASAQTDFSNPDMEPVNDLPNPYQTVENYLKLPAGREWGSTSAVHIDVDGESIWVAERCSGNVGACVQNSNLDPIMKFDADGNMVTSFGAGMITWPHGIEVDPQGNVWVTDARDNRGDDVEETEVYGHQVHKFSPEGHHMMTLGMPGGGRDPNYLFQPNDVLVAPDGHIFVAEGHSNAEGSTARILKFSPAGDLVMTWGSYGSGPENFMQPHALALDSQGRLFIADRSNNRIQIYTQDGELLDTWYQFSRNSGLFIDENDVLYAADSESGSVAPQWGHWTRGIRVGSARTGEVHYLIPDPQPDCRGTCTAEGVTVDRNGVIYGAEVGPVGGIKRYVRQ